MIKKIWKKLTPVVALMALTPLMTLSATTTQSTQIKRFEFNNRSYASLDEATVYFLKQNANNIKKMQVLGDADGAVIDQTYGLLNKNLLPDYDVSKISPAYIAADGTITNDQKRAISSYANKGLAQLKYTYPGADKTWYTEAEAEDEATKSVFNEVMYTADILKPGSNTDKIKINPTNATDIQNLKAALWSEFKDKDHVSGLVQDENGKIKQTGWTRGYVYYGYNNKAILENKEHLDNAIGLNDLQNMGINVADFENYIKNEVNKEIEINKELSNNPKQVSTKLESVRLTRKGLKLNFRTNVMQFNDDFLKKAQIDDEDNDSTSLGQSTDWFKGTYAITNNENREIIKYDFKELRKVPYHGNFDTENLNVEFLNNQYLKEGTQRTFKSKSNLGGFGLNITADQSGNNVTSSVKDPENKNVIPNFLPISLDGAKTVNENSIHSYILNFDNSKIDIREDNENGWVVTYHRIKAVGLKDVVVEAVVKPQIVINTYFKNYLTERKYEQSEINFGYFYNGRLMFKQPLLNNFAALGYSKELPTLENVSFSHPNNRNELSFGNGVNNVNNQEFTFLNKIWNANNTPSFFETLEEKTTLTYTDEFDRIGYIKEDEMSQLFNYMRRKHNGISKTELENNGENWLNQMKYDVNEKWLSFVGYSVQVDKANIPIIASTYESIYTKNYNIISGNNFNLSMTNFKDNELTNNGLQNIPYVAAAVTNIDLIKKTVVPKIARTWIFYDLLGEEITNQNTGTLSPLDSSQFDSIDLVETNIKAHANIKSTLQNGIIDLNKVYTQTPNGSELFVNKVASVFELEINQIKKHFKTYQQLYAYAYDYVAEKSFIIG